MTLFTVGYERLLPDALVAELRAAGVRRVLDVRYRPQSRRAGMSKTRLAERLAGDGIAYEHRRGLGTPPDLRVLFKAGPSRLAEARAAYAAHLAEHAGEELDALAAELRDPASPATALLCLEAEPHECHRSLLADALRERVDGLRVVDL